MITKCWLVCLSLDRIVGPVVQLVVSPGGGGWEVFYLYVWAVEYDLVVAEGNIRCILCKGLQM
jgi:hypothetical protein